jgi:GNAT superfamily N-acetyltransferase
MVVRLATVGDFVRLAALQSDSALILATDQEGQLAGLIRIRVGERGQRHVQGWLQGAVYRFLHPPVTDADAIVQPIRLGRIEEVFVAPAAQRQGVSTALVKGALQWLRVKQVDRVHATIPVGDEARRACSTGLVSNRSGSWRTRDGDRRERQG